MIKHLLFIIISYYYNLELYSMDAKFTEIVFYPLQIISLSSSQGTLQLFCIILCFSLVSIMGFIEGFAIFVKGSIYGDLLDLLVRLFESLVLEVFVLYHHLFSVFGKAEFRVFFQHLIIFSNAILLIYF